MSEIKETKAERVERIKKEKDGLDVLADIHALAKSGELADSDTVERLKWYGLYTQKPGTVDGISQRFMLRVKLIDGKATKEQLRVLGEVSLKYAQDTADISTRQAIQLHWIQIKDLPTIFEKLTKVGISTQMAAGDCPRNTVVCPVCDVDPTSYEDTSKYVRDINAFFQDNKNFSNLPRKFKIGVSACSCHCMGHEIQDVGFTGLLHQGKTLYDICIGGGLGSGKRIASRLGIACAGEDIVKVSKAVAQIHRDSGDRTSRTKARVRHIIDEWGVVQFREELEKIANDVNFIAVDEPKITPQKNRGHFGVHPSKVAGKSFIGTSLHGGILSGTKILKLVELMDKTGTQTSRVTTKQNIVFLDVPDEKTAQFVEALAQEEIYAYPNAFNANMVTCTGKQYCKFAVAETKDFGAEVAQYLKNRFPNFEDTICFNFSGCPNSCGHTHIGDFGFMGCKVKVDGETQEGYEIYLGGNLEGEKSQFAVKTGVKKSLEELPQFLGDIIEEYDKNRNSYANFQEYIQQKEI